MEHVTKDDFMFKRTFLLRIMFPRDIEYEKKINIFLNDLSYIFAIKHFQLYQRDILDVRELIIKIELDSFYCIRKRELFDLHDDKIRMVFINWNGDAIYNAELMLLLMDFQHTDDSRNI